MVLAHVFVAGCQPSREVGVTVEGQGADDRRAALSQPQPLLGPVAAALLATSPDHEIVCLGELHGSSADADLRAAIVHDPRFPVRFGQVLFEGASAAHQELLDRYVLEGEALGHDELAQVWRDAGRGLQWHLPSYRRLFDDLRALNQNLPASRRVRLVGGAPPIPWSTVSSPEQLVPWVERERWVHEQMRAAARQPRSTLAIYGRHHCERLRFEADPVLRDAVLSVLSVGPEQDEGFRRLTGLGGDGPGRGRPTLVVIDEQFAGVPVRDTWGEGHQFRDSRFGEIADFVVSYGALDHRIDVTNEADLAQDELAELRRRDRLMGAAVRLSAVVQEPSSDG